MLEVKRNATGPYIITICGSLRFTREMLMAHHEISRQGIMVFLPCIDLEKPIPKESSPFDEDAQTLHDAKISFGDGVLIMNVDGYIGESTFHEWQLARKLKKDIFWYSKDDEEAMEKTRQLLAEFDKKGGVK